MSKAEPRIGPNLECILFQTPIKEAWFGLVWRKESRSGSLRQSSDEHVRYPGDPPDFMDGTISIRVAQCKSFETKYATPTDYCPLSKETNVQRMLAHFYVAGRVSLGKTKEQVGTIHRRGEYWSGYIIGPAAGDGEPPTGCFSDELWSRRATSLGF
jgi:hypothetical protein